MVIRRKQKTKQKQTRRDGLYPYRLACLALNNCNRGCVFLKADPF